MNEQQRLEVYDHLREAHKHVKAIWDKYLTRLSANDEMAVDAVDNVLYLAEGVFAVPPVMKIKF